MIQTGVDKIHREYYKHFPIIFRNKKPIIFYDTRGKERRQRDSYANDMEKNLVLDVLAQFEENIHFDPKSVAVISNYHSQNYNLKSDIRRSRQFSKKTVENLEVDTVDAFQGREKDFVIISTVRANEHGKVGFWWILEE